MRVSNCSKKPTKIYYLKYKKRKKIFETKGIHKFISPNKKSELITFPLELSMLALLLHVQDTKF